MRSRPLTNERDAAAEFAPEPGRLLSRPRTPADGTAPLGLQTLASGGGRAEGLLYVPAGYRPDRALPLVVSLHGAGGTAQQGLDLLRPFADAAGFLLLAPQSRGRTWDVILDAYGPDVRLLDRALSAAFGQYAVDGARVGIGGFSDGASYALSLGVTNGDLFTHVLAFAPGFLAPAAERGRPRLFLAHGTEDRTLPIERCSRRIVPRVRAAGYDVEYHEFDGPHTVPPDIARQAVAWFLADSAHG